MNTVFKRIAVVAIAFMIAFAFMPDIGVSKAYAGDSINGGTHKASKLQEYTGENLFCSGNVEIIMDTNLTLWSLNSDYDIKVVNSGSTKHTLTLEGNDAKIHAKNITFEGVKVVVNPETGSDETGINADVKLTAKDSDVTVRMGTYTGIYGNSVYFYDCVLYTEGLKYGISSGKGSLLIKDSKVDIRAQEDECYAMTTNGGSVSLISVTGIIAAGDFYAYGIDSEGNVTFNDCYNLKIYAERGVCSAKGDIIIKPNCYVRDWAPEYKITKQGNYSDLTDTMGNPLNHAYFYRKSISYKPHCTITPTTIPQKVYTGSKLTPAVTVKWLGKTLTEGTDYTVTYSNNLDVGEAKVTIKGKGNYVNTVTKTFKIRPKGTQLLTPTAVSKGVTVKWNAQKTKMSTSYITGYKIEVAKDKNFTNGRTVRTVKGYSNTSKTITGLAGNTTYYIRIRTYKEVNGVTYYSPWCSTIKTVKTKA